MGLKCIDNKKRSLTAVGAKKESPSCLRGTEDC